MKQQTLGERIAALRKVRGLTQAELAAQMGVTDKAVSKWERDLSRPDVDTLPRLAEFFDMTVDALMRDSAEEGEPEPNVRRSALVDLILRAVAAAMGVAVTVLSVLRQIESESAFCMLGLGLTCLAICQLREKR